MANFKVAVEWAVYDELDIEADSLDEAKVKAAELPLTRGSYIDGSFQVNEEVTEELNVDGLGERDIDGEVVLEDEDEPEEDDCHD